MVFKFNIILGKEVMRELLKLQGFFLRSMKYECPSTFICDIFLDEEPLDFTIHEIQCLNAFFSNSKAPNMKTPIWTVTCRLIHPLDKEFGNLPTKYVFFQLLFSIKIIINFIKVFCSFIL